MKEKQIALYKRMRDNYRSQLNQRGENALSPEDADKAYAMIDELDALIKDLEAAPEEFTMKDVEAKVDEKIAELKETFKEKQQGGGAPTPAENYLRSTNSLHDFAEALRAGYEKRSTVKAAWGEALRTNGITITSGSEFGYLPDYVKGKIQDAWQHKFEWLNSLKRVSAKRYAIRYQTTDQDSTSPDVRAKGHTAGNAKTDVAFTMLAKSLECQFIYGKIKIDNETKFNDDAGLVDYVVDALTTQMQYEINRAVLVGDGRSSSSPDKIKKIDAIARSTSDAFVTVTTRDSNNAFIEDLRTLCDSVRNEDGEDVFLFISKADLTALCKHIYAAGGDVRYDSTEEMARQLGVTKIITSKLLGADKATYTYQAIAFCPSKYVMIGEDTVSFKTWEDMDYNVTGYRMERALAGAPEGLEMGAVMLVDPS